MKKRWLGVLILCCLFFAGCANAVKEGTAYLEEGKIEEARGKFETSIEKEKDLDEAYRGLGICYWEKSDYTKAMAAFEKALDNGTEETATLYNMVGICALKTQNGEKAVSYFAKGQEQSDAEGELLQEMAFNEIVGYEQLGKYSEAKQKLEASMTAYPDDETAAKELEFLNTQVKEN